MSLNCPSCGADLQAKVSLRNSTRGKRFPPNWKVEEYAGKEFSFVYGIDADYMEDLVYKIDGRLKENLLEFLKNQTG